MKSQTKRCPQCTLTLPRAKFARMDANCPCKACQAGQTGPLPDAITTTGPNVAARVTLNRRHGTDRND